MRAIPRQRAAAAALLALAVFGANPADVRSQTSSPAGFAVVAEKPLYTGVEYVKLAKSKGPVVAHIAHVLPGAPVELQVVNAFDRISTSPKDLETTSSMCRRTRCIVGVNGDFHRIGVPAGAVITDGRMLRSPEPDRPQLTVLKGGRLMGGTFPWTGSLTAPGGASVALSTVNERPPSNGLALFTPEHGPSTETSSRVELVVRAVAVGTLNKPTSMELLSLRSGGGPIPKDGAVLSGDGAAGQQLRDIWGRRQPHAPQARLLISSPLDADVSLGVEPVVLRDGKRATPWRDPNVIVPRQPHTLVGWNKEGHVYLIAVDGRQPASEGVTMAEAADFLVSLGVTDAVSLDGGGGTTFVAGGAVWNRPSDNDPDRPGHYAERGTANALVVMARPEAPARSRPPAAPPGRPAPAAVDPMNAGPEPPGPGPDDPAIGPPWIATPMTVDGEGAPPDSEAAAGGELPARRSISASGPVAASAPEAMRTTAGGEGPAGDNRSPEARAGSEPERNRGRRDGGRSDSDGAHDRGTNLSMAASGRSSTPADGNGQRSSAALGTVFGGAALAFAVGLAARNRPRAGRTDVACVPEPAGDVSVATVAADPAATVGDDVQADAGPAAESLLPGTDIAAANAGDPDDVQSATLTGGAGPDLFIERPGGPGGPVDSPERNRLFDLTDLAGFHRLALDHKARARIMANRFEALRAERPGVVRSRPGPGVDRSARATSGERRAKPGVSPSAR